jgi:hypothetical protein
MVPGKRTVFLLQETSGDLLKTTNLESTHLELFNLALLVGRGRAAIWLLAVWGSDRVCLIRGRSREAGT